VPPAGALRLRDDQERAVIPSAVDPGQAEQTITRGARLGSDRLVVHKSGTPGDGPLPGGRVDGRRDDNGHRCGEAA